MPNYCNNMLVIKGTIEQTKEVKKFLKGKPKQGEKNTKKIAIDFNNITPTPPWVYQGNLGKKEEEKYGKENCWYYWNKKNWGTKWNALEPSSYKGIITFKTAVTDVSELMSKLGIMFPDVRFDYYYASDYYYDDDYYVIDYTKFKVCKYEIRGTEVKKITYENCNEKQKNDLRLWERFHNIK